MRRSVDHADLEPCSPSTGRYVSRSVGEAASLCQLEIRMKGKPGRIAAIIAVDAENERAVTAELAANMAEYAIQIAKVNKQGTGCDCIELSGPASHKFEYIIYK
jgi:hypothetical protein